MSQFLTVEEVAERMRCEHRTVRRAIKSRELNAAMIGGRYLIRAEELHEWLDSQQPLHQDNEQSFGIEAEFGRLLREASESLCVYVIQRGDDGPLKIGHVKRPRNLFRRMRDIQNACAEKVYLRRIFQSSPCECLELVLHWRFAKHRLEGEWFAPAPEILAFIEEP